MQMTQRSKQQLMQSMVQKNRPVATLAVDAQGQAAAADDADEQAVSADDAEHGAAAAAGNSRSSRQQQQQQATAAAAAKLSVELAQPGQGTEGKELAIP